MPRQLIRRHHWMRNVICITAVSFALIITAAPPLAGCDKERCEPAAPAVKSSDRLVELRQAAETSVRVAVSNPASVRFRGVQVWPQAIKNQFAVCGQVNVFGPTSNTYVLFVVIVT